MTPTTEPAQRIATLFRRRLSTPWNEKEVRAYKKLYKDGCFKCLDDLSLLERYYVFQRRKGDAGIHRRDLYTFLNNYGGELDRARAWDEEQREKAKRRVRIPEANGEEPLSDAEFMRLGEIARKQIEDWKKSLC